MNIIGKRNWFFLISLLVIIPGAIFFVINFKEFGFGLNLGIDFIGGSKTEIQSKEFVNQNSKLQVKDIFTQKKIEIGSIQPSNDRLIIKSKLIDERTHRVLVEDLKKRFPDEKELSFETIGPTIGQEITINALKAILVASLLIVLYITWSFRSVPKPASSLRFGICAIIALLHDVLVVVGCFAILGHFLKVEVDSLFVTALLTIIGFSVHDTIVVFDRIRENLIRMGAGNFENVVNESINQTLVRSLNTSFTVILVLIALLLFGGESIRWFVVALLIGVTSGTYSSIFNAAPLLVVWQDLRSKR